MTHSLHKIRYKELFNGHELGSPHELHFSKNTKIIVISDCHLDSRFDTNVFEKLKKTIEKADVLVINGDFWADSAGSFEKFITSKWTRILPLLKAKKTYYIFGNHDMPLLSDERIYLFCDWAGFRLKIKAGDLLLHIEHGHLLSGILVRNILTIFEKYPKALKYATFPFGVFEEAMRFMAKKSGSPVMKKLNLEFKESRHRVSEKHEYFMMGHTHVPEFDQSARYVNSGRTHNGHFDYIEVHQNKITVQNL